MRIYVHIGPGAQFKNIEYSEDRETLSEEFVLMNEKVRYGHESPKE